MMTKASHSAAHYRQDNPPLTDAAQIAGILHRLKESRSLLTVIPDGSTQHFTSAVLHIDSRKNLLLLDELSPRAGHELLVNTGRFRVLCRCQGVDVRFAAQLREVGDKDGLAYYRLGLPREMHYLQRRQHYRVQLDSGLALPVQLPARTDARQSLAGEACDLSVSGLGLRLPRHDGLETGQVLTDCTLILPGDQRLKTAIEVCSARAEQTRQQWRIGARFLHLDAGQEQRLERLIRELERDILRRRRQ